MRLLLLYNTLGLNFYNAPAQLYPISQFVYFENLYLCSLIEKFVSQNLMNYFAKLDSYKAYLEKNPFHKLLNIDLDKYGEVEKKIENSVYHSVDHRGARSTK